MPEKDSKKDPNLLLPFLVSSCLKQTRDKEGARVSLESSPNENLNMDKII